MTHYDVIVVGAGLGGLTTAAMLTKKGVNVLLIEQHRMPGGCCTSIRREGVSMDVGTTIFYGFVRIICFVYSSASYSNKNHLTNHYVQTVLLLRLYKSSEKYKKV